MEYFQIDAGVVWWNQDFVFIKYVLIKTFNNEEFLYPKWLKDSFVKSLLIISIHSPLFEIMPL